MRRLEIKQEEEKASLRAVSAGQHKAAQVWTVALSQPRCPHLCALFDACLNLSLSLSTSHNLSLSFFVLICIHCLQALEAEKEVMMAQVADKQALAEMLTNHKK